MLSGMRIFSVLMIILGGGTFLYGYFCYLLIFPNGALKIFQYWWMKDYFIGEEKEAASKCFKTMMIGLGTVLVNMLFLFIVK